LFCSSQLVEQEFSSKTPIFLDQHHNNPPPPRANSPPHLPSPSIEPPSSPPIPRTQPFQEPRQTHPRVTCPRVTVMNTLPAELVAIVASHVDDIDSITGLCDAAGIAPDGKGPDGKGPDANYMDEMYSEKLARLDFVEPEPTEKKTLVQTPRFFSRLCRHPCDPANHLSEQTSSNFVTYTKSAQSWETYKKHAREQLMALLADQEEWHQYRTPLQILRAQIYGFVHYISNAHSWYKHISLLESTRRRAGQSFTPTFDLVVNMHQQDGKYTKKERGDGSEFHYTWRTTDAYRSAFNFLSYESRISSEDSDASPTPPVDSNGTQACAPRSFLMKEVAVTSAVHEATTGYVRERSERTHPASTYRERSERTHQNGRRANEAIISHLRAQPVLTRSTCTRSRTHPVQNGLGPRSHMSRAKREYISKRETGERSEPILFASSTGTHSLNLFSLAYTSGEKRLAPSLAHIICSLLPCSPCFNVSVCSLCIAVTFARISLLLALVPYASS